MKFKSVMSSINPGKIKSDVENAFDVDTDTILSDIQSGNLDPDNLMKQVESKIEPFEKVMTGVDQAKKVKDFFDDPISSLKTEVENKVKDWATEKVKELPIVDEIKQQLTDKAREKLMDIPQVQDAMGIIDQANSTIPEAKGVDDAENLSEKPENVSAGSVNLRSMIAKALSDSGYRVFQLRNEE